MTTPGYHTITHGAAIGSVEPRQPVAVAGTDRASFLHGLLTNDIKSLTPGTGCYAAWLTPQGRMLTDMHVLQSASMILLDLPADSAAATLSRLERFLFSEDVQLQSLAGSLTGVWVHGPAAANVLTQVFVSASGLRDWPDYRHEQMEYQGEPASVARIDQLGVPGYCVYLEASRESSFIAALEHAGAARVDAASLDAARIEAGYPVFGRDMTEDTIPLEAGIEHRAISFSKGCYVGQEVIIRVMHRGHGRVARRLVGLGFGEAEVPPGAVLHAGDREIGKVTSAARSPVSGTVALGYVHRDFTAPGTAVEARVDGAPVPGTVTRGHLTTGA